jgi:post-segregation antitoxin (ccd killing protein)
LASEAGEEAGPAWEDSMTENSILRAPDRAPASAPRHAGEIGLAAAAGTAAAAWCMMQLAPDTTMEPDLLELAKQQQLAISALANVAVTTFIATAMNMLRNWRHTQRVG